MSAAHTSVDTTRDLAVRPVIELIGNPRPRSRTRRLADAVTSAILTRLAPDGPDRVGSQVLELGELVGVSFGPEPARGSGAVADPFGLVRSAWLLVVATPTYKGTYSGLLKIFLDQFTQGELADAVAVPVALAAAPNHRRTVASALRDLLIELGAHVPAPPLAVLESELVARSAEEIATAWVDRHAAGVLAAGRDRQAVERPR